MSAAQKYLLDTSVYSQPLRRSPVMAALRRWDDAGDERCVISIVCRAETEWGLLKSPDPRRDHRYEALLKDRLEVLQSDAECWRIFSVMKARQIITGRIVSDLDLLIAATARCHDCIVATLNPNDFSKIEGIHWEDWSV
jgi:predicted nucleic acid-binding protein